jgi:hypothetical protein
MLKWSKQWSPEFRYLVYEGRTATGAIYTARKTLRGKKWVWYLDRPNYGTEVCQSLRHAKEYANELARLAGL